MASEGARAWNARLRQHRTRKLQGNEIPDRKLPRYASRDDCLPSGPGECALDAVKRQGRHAHTAHQHCGLVFRKSDRSANLILNILHRVVKPLVNLPEGLEDEPARCARHVGLIQ